MLDEIRVSAPGPGLCPVCAVKHDSADPHDLRSVYYMNRFYKQNRRFPTLEDAMSHCSELTKAALRQRIAEGAFDKRLD